METSILLAKVFGVYLVVIGISLLINRKSFQEVMGSFAKSPGVLFLGGVIALLFGLFIVNIHNVWKFYWVVIITIFGWASLIKGLTLMICPRFMIRMAEAYKKNTGLLIFQSLIVLVLGAVLIYAGYFS